MDSIPRAVCTRLFTTCPAELHPCHLSTYMHAASTVFGERNVCCFCTAVSYTPRYLDTELLNILSSLYYSRVVDNGLPGCTKRP